MTTTHDRDYVLGTHAEEIERLGLQHRVWRPKALDAWRRAGFTIGQQIMDVGCGPGFASLDLAELVGSTGRVIAVDRSRRFLDALEASRRARGLTNIEIHELDLDEAELPRIGADGAWGRWVFSFVKNPRGLLAGIARTLKRGGVLVLHEYFDYSTWRLAPRVPEIEDFVREVMASWREHGGEPDIALALPRWMGELGFELRSVSAIVDVVPPSSFVWHWPSSFVRVGLERLVELGRLTTDQATAITRALAEAEAAPDTLMITPAVLEMVAVLR
ncbi:MAG: methyltransferase domain-containing protein [Planctomycetota bacterium]